MSACTKCYHFHHPDTDTYLEMTGTLKGCLIKTSQKPNINEAGPVAPGIAVWVSFPDMEAKIPKVGTNLEYKCYNLFLEYSQLEKHKDHYVL